MDRSQAKDLFVGVWLVSQKSKMIFLDHEVNATTTCGGLLLFFLLQYILADRCFIFIPAVDKEYLSAQIFHLNLFSDSGFLLLIMSADFLFRYPINSDIAGYNSFLNHRCK